MFCLPALYGMLFLLFVFLTIFNPFFMKGIFIMKRLFFAFVAIVAIATGSAYAQGARVSVKYGPVVHTIGNNEGGSLCLSAGEQELCYTEDEFGHSGVSVRAVIPVSPATSVTGEFSYTERGNFNGCFGARVGVPKYNAGLKNCVGRQDDTIHIYSDVYGNAGRVGAGYESDHLKLRPRDPNAPRIPDNPWIHPKY